jgi:glycosyltransferase involved in cell wall biosynthesis
MRAAPELRVLSLGYTRSLWDARETNDNVRLRAYAAAIGRYTLVVNSRRRHRLHPLQVAENCRAIATGGWTPFDNFIRLLLIGHRELRRQPYDVIQAQDPSYMGMVAWLLGRWHGVRVNVCVYGPNPYDIQFLGTSWLNRMLAPVARFVLQRCEGIQVDGRLAAESLQQHGIPARKIHRKPMIPSDVEEFFRIERPLRVGVEPVTLLFAGRLVPQKNLGWLLRVFAEVRRRAARPVCLRLVGAGPQREVLVQQVREAQLEDAVVLPGSQDRAGMVQEFRQADVFVLPSTYEGYPRVLIEAAAAGLAAVSTRVGGADEMIRDGETGYIIAHGDEPGFTAALVDLVDGVAPRERMGQAARAHAAACVAQAASPSEQIRIWEHLVSDAKR